MHIWRTLIDGSEIHTIALFLLTVRGGCDFHMKLRREVRDRSRSSPYPSIRRLRPAVRLPHRQPHCPCEPCSGRARAAGAMKSMYLGSQVALFQLDARRRFGAGSTTFQTIRVHFARECGLRL